MRFLLDTHALLWWLFDDPRLSGTVREIVADAGNEIVVSSASTWEISTKHHLGKLPAAKQLVRDISGWVERAGFAELPVTIGHAQRAGSWAQAHRDPFDRMLIAQVQTEDMWLVSKEDLFDEAGVRRYW